VDDSADLLVEDILAAGAGASLRQAARILAEEGPKLLQEVLVQTAGIEFDRLDNGEMDWGRKGRIPGGGSCTWATERAGPSWMGWWRH